MATIFCDGEDALFEGAKLGLQQQGTELALPEEFILEVEPHGPGARVPKHQRLLQIIGADVVDPR